MSKLLTVLLVVFVTGCASTRTFNAAPQNYRAKGEDKSIDIKGDLFIRDEGFSRKVDVNIYFNNQVQIKIPLDKRGSGESNGDQYNGKNTSASCTSKVIDENNSETRCMIFIENERTVTLTF